MVIRQVPQGDQAQAAPPERASLPSRGRLRTAGWALWLAPLWLSPAALLGVGPLLLADGTRGLWPPLVLAGGALLAVLLLAGPWSRLAGHSPLTLLDLAVQRWPAAEGSLAPLMVGQTGSALLFLWAQLAVGREFAETLGWSTLATIGGAAVVLALAAWRDEVGVVLGPLGGALALLGLVVPLAVTLAATTPWWPRVWAEVASRERVIFSGSGAWTTEGRPVRGVGREVTLAFRDEQRVTLLRPGRVRVEYWEGGGARREVTAGAELTLRPGDRLVVPAGFPLRFQAGRRIPGAPATGPHWLDPPGARSDWRVLVGLGVTLLLGAAGLAPVHSALPAGPAAEEWAARVGAGLAVLGAALAILWAVYAAWLTPEVYIGGVAGVEVYELPESVVALGAWRRWLRLLALGGLAAGGIAAALAALRGVPRRLPADSGWPAIVAVGAVLVASALAVVTPVQPWPLLLAAFALAASTGAPAAVLACWSERVTARGLTAGATLGLVVFVGLSVMGLAGFGGGRLERAPDSSWLGWLTAWPALVAMPVNALTALLFASRPAASSRSPLPPGLADLHP